MFKRIFSITFFFFLGIASCKNRDSILESKALAAEDSKFKLKNHDMFCELNFYGEGPNRTDLTRQIKGSEFLASNNGYIIGFDKDFKIVPLNQMNDRNLVKYYFSINPNLANGRDSVPDKQLVVISTRIIRNDNVNRTTPDQEIVSTGLLKDDRDTVFQSQTFLLSEFKFLAKDSSGNNVKLSIRSSEMRCGLDSFIFIDSGN